MKDLILGIIFILMCVAFDDFIFTLIFEYIRRMIKVKHKHILVFSFCFVCAVFYVITMFFITNIFAKLFVSGFLLAIVNIFHLEFQDIFIEYDCSFFTRCIVQLLSWVVLFFLTLLFFSTPIIV
jgi:hypothetical protein